MSIVASLSQTSDFKHTANMHALGYVRAGDVISLICDMQATNNILANVGYELNGLPWIALQLRLPLMFIY
jgi:hypothetical protein